MQKQYLIDAKYLNIPVAVDKECALVEFFLIKEGQEPEKVMEFNIPMDRSGAEEYPTKYFTQLPVEEYQGEVLELCGEMTETFCQAIYTTDEMNHIASSEIRPAIHFTADSGWTNDPNGMVYANGVYHLYYQYNPFDLVWNNMSWGHAVSPDMLHWERKDPVMFPDENGTIYSGCAIRNDRELLGLPKEALIFFYTAAGGINPWSGELEFTQRIAYSLDGGETLVKTEDPCVPVIYKDTRDPKVFWHEESQAYIMVLWTKGNDFAVLRSENLKDWELTHEFTLDGGWECPDLFNLKSPDGETCWFFWSADGYYYIGEFDGYHFNSDGKKHSTYLSSVPYAAQTYSGVEDRVISIPWLRLRNDGRCFTSSYGIPVEMSCKKKDGQWILIQKPIRELMEHASPISQFLDMKDDVVQIYDKAYRKAVVIYVKLKEEGNNELRWKLNGTVVEYTQNAGRLRIDNKSYHVSKEERELLFIVDDRILEVFSKQDGMIGTFETDHTYAALDIDFSGLEDYEIYEID